MAKDGTDGWTAGAGGGGEGAAAAEERCFPPIVGRGEVVREGGGTGMFSERHLQCVWGDVRLRPGGLRTAEGEAVEVESAGEWNTGAGPDFLRAVLRVGDGGRRVCGDVEIHVRPVDWRSHGHGKDPRYRGVCAHVTYYTGVLGAGELPPGTLQIALRPLLEARADFSFEDIDLQAYPTAMRGPEPPCQEAMLELGRAARGAVLDAAGRQRLARRAEALRLAIADRGAGQVLYEEGMAALGYGGNKAAMRHLARVVPLAVLRERSGGDVLRAYALLAGTAGLLPDVTGGSGEWDGETREFVRRCWDEWWRMRGGGGGGGDFGWSRGRMRPANRPERRLMAAAALFAPADGMPERMERLAKGRAAGNFRRLAGVLETGAVPYWGRRLGYSGERTGREVSLLGRGRRQAVTTNLLLPMLGALGAPEGMWNGLVEALPAEEGNRVTRTMASRLFGRGGGGCGMATGLRLQGLVHLHHEFCLEDRTGCERCPLVEMLRGWRGLSGGSEQRKEKSEEGRGRAEGETGAGGGGRRRGRGGGPGEDSMGRGAGGPRVGEGLCCIIADGTPALPVGRAALAEMLGRVEGGRGRFAVGTAQRTLADRRVAGLRAALEGGMLDGEGRRALESMLRKVEKAGGRLRGKSAVRLAGWAAALREALREALGREEGGKS